MATRDTKAERDKIDAQISALEGQIRALKVRRNTLTAAGSIPTELLNAIFAECLEEWPINRDGATWLAIPHVCSLWRSIVLKNPSLWANIDIDLGPDWMKCFLERSEGRPISLRVALNPDGGFPHEETDIIGTIFQDHYERLNQVTILLRGQESDRLVAAIAPHLNKGMPILTQFLLHSEGGTVLTLPTPLFANYAPKLSVLSLDNCDVSWSTSTFINLTSLSLINSDVFCELDRQPVGAFFDILSQMRELQHLHLESVLPTPDQYASNVGICHLSSLKSLELTDSWAECSSALPHMRIPGSATITLSVADVEDMQDMQDLIAALDQSWHENTLLRTQDITLLPDESATFPVEMCISGAQPRISFHDVGTGTKILDLVLGNSTLTGSQMELVMNSIAVESIADLSIVFTTAADEALKTVFRRLTSVTHCLMYGSMTRVFDTLTRQATFSGEGTAADALDMTYYFPRLATFTFQAVRFREEGSSSRMIALKIEKVKGWLHRRSFLGDGVRHVKIENCYGFTEQLAAQLRDCIGEGSVVHWDGKGANL